MSYQKPHQEPQQELLRQQVLVLYLSSSALDARVVAWASYDGTGRTGHMAGDESEPPYQTGLQALRDGWRLIQASPLIQHEHGEEFRTGYLKYEFFFEKLTDVSGGHEQGVGDGERT